MLEMAHHLIAVNTAPESENRMHGDEARRYGFRGGLVPGVDVLAYVVPEALDRWGDGWLGGGRLSGRLLLPVYDGEAIDVTTVVTDEGMTATVVGPDGGIRAEAQLSSLVDAQRAVALNDTDLDAFAIMALPEPDDRPAASPDRLEPGTVLGTQYAGFHADRATGYLAEISETHAAFHQHRRAHPGWLLRFANWALSSTVRLGPWIHVSSDLQVFEPVTDGDQLEVRARVTDRFARRGHELVELTAVYLVEGGMVARCDHRAIWQPRAGVTT